MAVLEGLEPRRVFYWFERIAAIPHGSYHTKAISDFLVSFAGERGLACRQDGADNVVIWKDATAGYEHAGAVIVQGHIDMVCERTPGCAKDMEREGLDLFVDGDLIGARGTTLGGDDGVAVAMALALLEADDIPHPALEVVLTANEEVGLLGASALDMGDLKAERLINLDSEAEGVLTVSCAGGSRVDCRIPVRREPFAGEALRIAIGGLASGHSGEEINKGRANAHIEMGRVLTLLAERTDARLARVDGGSKDNVIACESAAVVVAADAAAAREAAAAAEAALREEHRLSDPGAAITVEAVSCGETPMDADSTRRVAALLHCAPNGVQAMSMDVPGLVQTSLNCGIAATDADAVTVSFMVRSSVNTQRALIVSRLTCLSEALGGAAKESAAYPAWEYRADSPLRELLVETYHDLYGEEMRVTAIHAGLECGIFAGKRPGLDCVSYGPDMHGIHTPRERLSISSTERVWRYTLEALRRMK